MVMLDYPAQVIGVIGLPIACPTVLAQRGIDRWSPGGGGESCRLR